MTDSQRNAIVDMAVDYVETIRVWELAEQHLRSCSVADGYEVWAEASVFVSDAMAEHVTAELALIRAVKATTRE